MSDAPATPAAPVTPAPAAPASLIPDPATVKAEAPATPPAAPLAVDPKAPAKWLLREGVEGTGPPPTWFKADKYKTVEAQAEAYAHLEPRFGAFTGAPKDGKYEFKLPDGVEGEFDKDHPLLQDFGKWAGENQLSQEGYQTLLGMFAEYEASLAPDMGEIKKQLGENADSRINATAAWAKANLSEDEYKTFQAASSDVNAAAVFKTMEAIIAKTRQPRVPKGNEEVPGASPTVEAQINEMQAKTDPKTGKRLYETDPVYRAKVETARMNLYNSRQQPQVGA